MLREDALHLLLTLGPLRLELRLLALHRGLELGDALRQLHLDRDVADLALLTLVILVSRDVQLRLQVTEVGMSRGEMGAETRVVRIDGVRSSERLL